MQHRLVTKMNTSKIYYSSQHNINIAFFSQQTDYILPNQRTTYNLNIQLVLLLNLQIII